MILALLGLLIASIYVSVKSVKLQHRANTLINEINHYMVECKKKPKVCKKGR